MLLIYIVTAYLYWSFDINIYMKIPERFKIIIFVHAYLLKKCEYRFTIVVVYSDDMNLIGTHEELLKTAEYLKIKFQIKDLRKTKQFEIEDIRKTKQSQPTNRA